MSSVMAIAHSTQPILRTSDRKSKIGERLKMPEVNRTLRNLRMLQWGLIAASLIFAGVTEIVCVPGSDYWTLKHWLITGLALWAGLGAFRLRNKLLERSRQALAKDASDPKGLKQWEVGHGIALSMAGGVAMWGLVVRFVLIGALRQASLFYAAGILLLLLWTPRPPIVNPSN
jgi:hypothetical protein